MEKFWLAVLQMFIWCEILLGLLCLSAVAAGSDQEHCFVPAPSDEDTDPCPPWFIPQNKTASINATVECVCGPPNYGIRCHPKTCNTSLRIQQCLTYNPVTKTQVVGFCFFESLTEFMTTLPSNVSELNDFVCGGFNREGQLCGACKKGYGPALFTDFKCAKCSSQNYGWALYLLIGFLPITLFYVVIVMFQVSATSGPLNVFIFSSQIIATAMSLDNLLFASRSSSSQVIQQILITFYGVWSLDFFRSVIPPFCVSENITTLQAIALQYLPAFYPLLLIAATYVLIELHDRNIRVVVWMWRPFHMCLAPFQKSFRWNPKASIVSIFATFLTLVYSKLILISGELLIGSRVTDLRGNSSYYLILAPTVPYFGEEHLPFAILAFAVLPTFVALPPLLLLIYPTKTFQKLLGCLKIRWPALHIFADVFQGCYKNRTDGKYDCRWFAALYFIIRITVIVICVIPNIATLGWTIAGIILISGSLMFALLRPYKKNWLNILDSLILASLGLATMLILHSIQVGNKAVWIQLVGFIIPLPLVYFVAYVAYRLLTWFEVPQKCRRKLRSISQSLQRRRQGHNFRQELCDEEQLPDRMVNPCEYQPLPENRNKNEDEDFSETDTLPVIGAYTNDYGSTH